MLKNINSTDDIGKEYGTDYLLSEIPKDVYMIDHTLIGILLEIYQKVVILLLVRSV